MVSLFMWSLRRLLVTGLATGLPLAALAATFLQRGNLLPGIQLSDPRPYGVAMLVLISAACMAAVIAAMIVACSEPSFAVRRV